MTGAVLLGVVAAAGAVALAVPPRGQPTRTPSPGPQHEDPGWLLRHRLVWSLLAGIGALTFVELHGNADDRSTCGVLVAFDGTFTFLV